MRGAAWRAEYDRAVRKGLHTGYNVWVLFQASEQLKEELGRKFTGLPKRERLGLIRERARRIELRQRRPSGMEMLRWWRSQPEKDYTCEACGKTGPKSIVHPQHPYYAEGREGVSKCAKCIAEINRRRRR